MTHDPEHSYLINLPFPVSTNRLWRIGSQRHGKYVHISPTYHKWKQAADALYLTQKRRLGVVKLGKFSIDIVLAADIRRASQDGDNFIKCVLDWLQRVEIVHDDCLCESGSWAWGIASEGCSVVVWGDAYKKLSPQLAPSAPSTEESSKLLVVEAGR